ncbi:MAG: Por secretion system protein, partial [Prevotella sp.]|nr:Por secretion system protein [Prevotella sp.]
IRDSRFSFSFAVPKDVSYSNGRGLMSIYVVNDEKTLEGHGKYGDFTLSGTADINNDGIGPSIYCYLNSESFTNGGKVNSTPYFVARLTDNDGINAAGSGIGHDLELIIDGQMSRTYNLNEYFKYEFGDYHNGTVGFSIPALSEGQHKLLFRAWDVLNNSSTAELTFIVDPKLEPTLINVFCTNNPAEDIARFVINHDRAGSQMDVILEIFDTSGRKLWEKRESGVPTDHTYMIDWDLCVGNGSRLHTGIYLYRVLISNNGSTQATKAKKLIVVGNK